MTGLLPVDPISDVPSDGYNIFRNPLPELQVTTNQAKINYHVTVWPGRLEGVKRRKNCPQNKVASLHLQLKASTPLTECRVLGDGKCRCKKSLRKNSGLSHNGVAMTERIVIGIIIDARAT